MLLRQLQLADEVHEVGECETVARLLLCKIAEHQLSEHRIGLAAVPVLHALGEGLVRGPQQVVIVIVFVHAERAEEAGEHFEVEMLLEVALAFVEFFFLAHLSDNDCMLPLHFEHLLESLQEAATQRLPILQWIGSWHDRFLRQQRCSHGLIKYLLLADLLALLGKEACECLIAQEAECLEYHSRKATFTEAYFPELLLAEKHALLVHSLAKFVQVQ